MESSNALIDKPKLVAQPICFPFGALCGQAGSPYIYRSAALIDVQVAVDYSREIVVVTTCWRVEAMSDYRGRCRSFVLEGIVGRSEVPLSALRAQQYLPLGSTVGGPSQTEDLIAAGPMTLVNHSAALDTLQLHEGDYFFQKQLEDAIECGDPTTNSSKAIKVNSLIPDTPPQSF